MKKLSMFLIAVVTVSFSATAQQTKYDPAGLMKKISSSNADIAHAKKSERAATWLDRGALYYQAYLGPVGPLYKGLDAESVTLLMGEPESISETTINNDSYQAWEYDGFTVYFRPGGDAVTYWEFTKPLVDNGLETSYEAYLKAYELDPSTADKVIPGIQCIVAAYKEKGDLAFTVNNYSAATDAFLRAYDIAGAEPVNDVDSSSIFNAGYTALFNDEYARAIPLLEKALEYDFELDGEMYYLLFYAHYNLKDMEGAQKVLEEGIVKYPGNPKLVENLVFVYNTTGQDDTQLIPIIQGAMEKDPDNFIFHFGMGMIYDKLDDLDNAEISFKRASELNPDDFSSFYNLGMMYIRRAELLIPELNDIPMNEQERYDAKLAEMNGWYRQSIEPIRKAYDLRPTDPDVVDALKNMYFRFRNESPEMMEQYEKFNEIYESM